MTVEPFTRVSSKATPLLVDNIDTDVITPIGRVLEGREVMMRYAFEPLRFGSDGALDLSCPLNDRRYAGAEILIAGENFGCGSSRETAVWAVRGLGYRVILAKGFGDIFYSNCFKNGVLAIALSAGEISRLAEVAMTGGNFTVDLDAQQIAFDDTVLHFQISELRKEILAFGLDDLGLISRREEALLEFERVDAATRPWVYRAEK